MAARNRDGLAIERLPLASLKVDPRNPRKHSTRQVRQLALSIQEFGFNTPILIDADNKILAGHGRLLACQHLRWERVPCVRLSDLTEPQARAFSIADNRLTDASTWDDKMLAEVLSDLAKMDLDFSIEATGFMMPEIDLRIEALSVENESAVDSADATVTPAAGPPISKLGDVWLMGPHKIVCGDARDRNAYATLLDRELAHLVFTDPPYNVPIAGNVSGKGAIRHREFLVGSGEMTDPQFVAFLATVSDLMCRHTVPGSIHFICMDWRHLLHLLRAGHEIYSELKNVCVWVKHNAGMGSLYRSQHELISVFKNGAARHTNNVELGRHGRSRTNVWRYPGPSNFGRPGEEGDLLALHPTVKPVALIADAILDCSARGELVLDPFLGSGSTLLAAERVGRACRCMELDPLYVDTCIRRWQTYCGGNAIHAQSGKSFDDLAGGSSVEPQ
jgi:DNA modification methylase